MDAIGTETVMLNVEAAAHCSASLASSAPKRSTKMTESECVAELFKRYQTLVGEKP